MEKNKSIDGLAFRRDKKTVAKPTSIDGIATKKKTVRRVKATDSDIKKIKVELEAIKEELAEDSEPKASVDDFLAPVEAFSFDTEESEKPENDKDTKDTEESNEDEKTMDKKELKKLKKEEKKEAKKAKKTKKSKVKTIIVTILLSIIVLVLGAACWLFIWGNDIIMRITGGNGNIFEAIGVLTSDTYEPLKTDSKGRTNILAFGTSGYDMAGDEGNGVHDGAQLTDSIMAISIDQNTGDIAMISLPRDLKASPTCTATSKINEVFFCKSTQNNGVITDSTPGANALMTEVGDILGMDFQYYVHINWGSLVSIVNILDGITVTLDEDINDYEYTGAVFNAGTPYTINGEQALGLARARHGTANGDFSRGNSQQKILIGIKNKIYEKNLSLIDLVNLTSTLGDNLRTNLNVSEIKTAAHLTFEFDLESMRQIPLVDYDKNIYYFTTANINNISYVVPSAGVGNYRSIHTYLEEQLNSNPITREGAKIKILNGSDQSGVAGAMKEELTKAGFNISAIGDAEDGEYPEYTIYAASGEFTETLKALEDKFGVAHTEKDMTYENCDIIIILGNKPAPIEAE